MPPAGEFTCQRDSNIEGDGYLLAFVSDEVEVEFELAKFDPWINRVAHRIPVLAMEVTIIFDSVQRS